MQLLDGLDHISDRNLSFTIAYKTMAQIEFDSVDKHIRERLLKMIQGVGPNPIAQSTPQERSYLVSTPNIPTSSETIPKNLAVINQYFRDCKTKGCDTRFEAWPEALKHNIQ